MSLPLTVVIGDSADERYVKLLENKTKMVAVDQSKMSTIPAMNPVIILVWHSVSVDGDFLAQCTVLRAVIRMGTGYDSVDTATAANLGIAVCNLPSYGTEEVADAAMSHILNVYRRTLQLEAWTRKAVETGQAQVAQAAKGVTRMRGQKPWPDWLGHYWRGSHEPC